MQNLHRSEKVVTSCQINCLINCAEDGFSYEISKELKKINQFSSTSATKSKPHNAANDTTETELHLDRFPFLSAKASSSPTKKNENHGIYKLSKYTEKEIQSSNGFLEKERKAHFNKIYESIVDDSRFYDSGRQTIEGLIDLSWTKKKSELLFPTIKKMTPSQNFDHPFQSEQSLMSLYDKILQAKFNCDKGYETFVSEL